MLKLEDLGEIPFLERLTSWIKTRNPKVKIGIGDDALVLADGTVVTSDAYSEDIHFSQRYFNAEEIGYKAAGATLSDIAAMGAEPICLLVNLFAPRQLEVEFVQRIYTGIQELTDPLNVEIAGGDTVADKKLVLSCTALGYAKKPLLRSTAAPGEALYISGFPGLSEVGQVVLGIRRKMEGFDEAKARHMRPEPRIALGLELQGKASSCIDISDGLSTDAMEIAKASKVKLVIEHGLLPRHPEILAYAERFSYNWDTLVLNGGEDFELLFTSSRQLPHEMAGLPIHRIGRIEKGKGAYLEIEGKLKPLLSRGYDHFNA
ncbi:thiamine-phosphate kinase [candidate division WOR-3 bacterium]|nr:thiamine-phosphate kinase [candidate division WOR-3 bacterium]